MTNKQGTEKTVLTHQGDTPEWEEMKGQIAQAILGKLEYRGFYDAGKYLDDDIIEAIEPFIHKLLLQAKEQERQEIVEAIENYKMSEDEKSAEKRELIIK